jgi:tRNA-Thr(GGU) m(6)t(6)A37 methyltransferase TsaA
LKHDINLVLHPIAVVRSPLTSRKNAPRQGREGAPEAWVEIDPAYADAVAGISAGDEIILVSWLHQSDRDVLKVHPRGNPRNPLTGVFATRSPDRPNPIGLHRVRVVEVDEASRLRVAPLEAVDGTPIVDIKPVLHGSWDG